MPKTINDIIFQNATSHVTEDENKPSRREQEVAYLLDQLFSKVNIEMKTDLSPKSIKAITRGKAHSAIFNDDTLSNLCDTIMVLNVSKDRQGRKEATELMRDVSNEDEEGKGLKDLVNRLGGHV